MKREGRPSHRLKAPKLVNSCKKLQRNREFREKTPQGPTSGHDLLTLICKSPDFEDAFPSPADNPLFGGPPCHASIDHQPPLPPLRHGTGAFVSGSSMENKEGEIPPNHYPNSGVKTRPLYCRDRRIGMKRAQLPMVSTPRAGQSSRHGPAAYLLQTYCFNWGGGGGRSSLSLAPPVPQKWLN